MSGAEGDLPKTEGDSGSVPHTSAPLVTAASLEGAVGGTIPRRPAHLSWPPPTPSHWGPRKTQQQDDWTMYNTQGTREVYSRRGSGLRESLFDKGLFPEPGATSEKGCSEQDLEEWMFEPSGPRGHVEDSEGAGGFQTEEDYDPPPDSHPRDPIPEETTGERLEELEYSVRDLLRAFQDVMEALPGMMDIRMANFLDAHAAQQQVAPAPGVPAPQVPAQPPAGPPQQVGPAHQLMPGGPPGPGLPPPMWPVPAGPPVAPGLPLRGVPGQLGPLVRTPRPRPKDLLEATFDGNPEELAFFTVRVHKFVEESRHLFRNEAALIDVISARLKGDAATWYVGLHNDRGPELLDLRAFMWALRARFEDVNVSQRAKAFLRTVNLPLVLR